MTKKLLLLLCLLSTEQTYSFTAYVTDQTNNTVVPINTSTNSVGTPIAVDVGAHGVAITSDNRYVYVANIQGGSGSGSISIIDTQNNNNVTTFTYAGINFPYGIAIAPNGNVYVANSGTNTVTYFPANGAVPGSVNTITVGSTPINIAVARNGIYAYVANSGSNTVSRITLANNTVTTIGSGTFNGAYGVAVTPDSSTVYVTNQGLTGTVYYFPASSPATITAITTGVPAQPLGIAITPDGTLAYVACDSGQSVIGISTVSHTVVATLSGANIINPIAVAITPDNKTVYVTNNIGSPNPNVAYFAVNTTSPINSITSASFSSPFYIAITHIAVNPSDGIYDILTKFALALNISVSPTSGDRSLAATIAPHSPFNVTVSPSQGLWDIVFNMGTAVGSSPSPEQGVRELLVNMAPFV